jgi:hypothetical protein
MIYIFSHSALKSMGEVVGASESPNLDFWNLTQLSVQRLDRELPIAIRDGLAVMPRNCIDHVRCKAKLPGQRFESMSPGVAWGSASLGNQEVLPAQRQARLEDRRR